MRPHIPLALLAATVVTAACTGSAEEPAEQGAAAPTGVESDAEAAPPPEVPTIMVEGTLTACVAMTPGVAEEVDGDWQGFDVAVLEGVADELGLDLDVVTTGFDEIASGVALNSGQCEVAAAAVVDSDALDAVVTTSAPYRTVHRLVVTSSPSSEVAPDEVTGRVGVEEGGPAADAVDALSAAEVVGYPSRTDLGRALVEGAVDAALISARTRTELEDEIGVELSLRAAVPTEDETVLLLPLAADDDLVDAVDGALGTLREAGRLETWRDEWLRG